MEAMLGPTQGGLRRWSAPEVSPALGKTRYRVGFIEGCIMPQFFSQTNAATVRVLAANGCVVYSPPRQSCCGALQMHTGDRETARDLARRNIDAFEPLALDAIIINAAGCGSTLKEYGHLLSDDPEYADRAHAFTARVRDVSEFLASIELVEPHDSGADERDLPGRLSPDPWPGDPQSAAPAVETHPWTGAGRDEGLRRVLRQRRHLQPDALRHLDAAARSQRWTTCWPPACRPSWRPILAARCSSPTAPAAEASPSSSSTSSICSIAPTAAQRLARRHSACSSSDRNIHETSA